MNILHEDDSIRVSILENDTQGDVCICFTGVGHALGGIDVQAEEFRNANFFGVIIFVVDKHRSWGNLIDFELLTGLIHPYILQKKVNVLGNSMGAFIGTVFSYYLHVDCCIGFVPQYSISEEILPEESRWRKYTSKIKKIEYPTINKYFAEKTKYYFFSGNSESERLHWSKFDRVHNIYHYVIKGYNHNVAKALKEKGALYPLIEACYKNTGVENTLVQKNIDYYKI